MKYYTMTGSKDIFYNVIPSINMTEVMEKTHRLPKQGNTIARDSWMAENDCALLAKVSQKIGRQSYRIFLGFCKKCISLIDTQ